MDFIKWKFAKKKIKTMIGYLSGAMEFSNDEGAGWRNDLTIWLESNIEHKVFNPVI